MGSPDSLSIGVPQAQEGTTPGLICLLRLRRPDRRAIGATLYPSFILLRNTTKSDLQVLCATAGLSCASYILIKLFLHLGLFLIIRTSVVHSPAARGDGFVPTRSLKVFEYFSEAG